MAKSKRKTKTSSPPPTFGRSQTPQSWLSDLGCPDCRGVLAISVEEHDLFVFRCRVGHAFTLDTLLPSKEDALEAALWTAIELCEEMSALQDAVYRRAIDRNLVEDQVLAKQRGRTARAHGAALRVIVAADGPAFTARRGRT